MINWLILLLSLSSFSFAQNRIEAQAIIDHYSQVHKTAQRLEVISRFFLNRSYGSGGPLGEGTEGRYDQDPLYRFDSFDCTTFVETVISLALAGNVYDFEKIMNEIRYQDGRIDYLKRNHFPSLQWIPNNVQSGYLEEINHLILPAQELEVAEAMIDLPRWLKSIKLDEIRVPLASHEERRYLLEELQALSSQVAPVSAKLHYIPISLLLELPHLLKRIPSGTIVNFVRPAWDLREVIGTHMNVSHQGFIFHGPKGSILRHASSSAEKKVMENDLYEYLKTFESHPTLKGIHLMKVR